MQTDIEIVFIDAGAHTGDITASVLQAAAECGRRISCYMFEPWPKLHDSLCRRFADDSRVKAIECKAVCAVTKPLQLYPETTRFLGTSIYASKHNVSRADAVTVAGVAFHEWFFATFPSRAGRLFVLKVNIEGAELDLYRCMHVHGLFDMFSAILVSNDGLSDIRKCTELVGFENEASAYLRPYRSLMHAYYGDASHVLRIARDIFSRDDLQAADPGGVQAENDSPTP